MDAVGESESVRVLAIDLGKKRMGLAISDPLGHFAVGLETLELSRKIDPLAEVETLCRKHDIGLIVLGLPKNMNGTEGPMAEKARAFAEALTERTGLHVELLDERLTTVLAHQTLQSQGIQPSRQKGLVDQAAAKRILQDYLDREAHRAQRALEAET